MALRRMQNGLATLPFIYLVGALLGFTSWRVVLVGFIISGVLWVVLEVLRRRARTQGKDEGS